MSTYADLVYEDENCLNRTLYSFCLLNESVVVLNNVSIQARPSKRHGWKTSKVWSRLDGRMNNMDRPTLPQNVMDDAVKLYRDRIRFEDQS